MSEKKHKPGKHSRLPLSCLTADLVVISRGLVVIGHNGRFFPQFIGVFLHIAVDFLPDFRRDLVFEEGKRLAALLSHVVVRGVAHLLDLDQLCILHPRPVRRWLLSSTLPGHRLPSE